MEDNVKEKDQQVADTTDKKKSEKETSKQVKDTKAGKGKSLTGKPLDPIDLTPQDNTQKNMEEAVNKTVVFTFGRMNPPTIGHQKLVDKVKATAKVVGGDPKIFLSHSEDSSKNPLPYSTKVALAKKAFGNIVAQSMSKNIIDILKELSRSYHNAILVVGSDRVADFKRMTQNYNGKDFTFDSIRVVSAGERDPDAEGASGMSASKMRAAAKAEDLASFKKGLPQKLQSMAPGLMSTIKTKLDEEFEAMMMNEEFEQLDEAPLTMMQRRKRGMIFKRYKSRIKRGREIAKRKMADQKKLAKRARKAAIGAVRKRYAGEKGASYATLSPSEKIQVDKRIEGKGKLIDRLAKKLLPKVRKAELVRLQTHRHKKVTEALDPNRQKAMDAAMAAVNDVFSKRKSEPVKTKRPTPPPIKDPHADKHPVWRRGYADGKRGVRDRSASDAYGPDTHHYHDGYTAGSKEVKEISTDLRRRYNTSAKSDLDHQKMSARIAGEIGAKDAKKYHQRKAKNRAVGIMRTEEKTPQDQDIADRKGTQPARYHKGLAPSTKAKRDAQFKKQTKMASDDPRAYKPAPGDKSAKTKPSKYTRMYKQMFGEEIKGKQLVHHGETTKNFEICPSALQAFHQNQKDGMGDKEGFHDAVVAVDKYLGFEKALSNKGSANQADLEKMKDLVSDAKSKISAAGLKGHDYHSTHINAVADLVDDNLKEMTTPQTIRRHNPLMKPKYKSAIRHYLNLRRKEPGQGRSLVTKANATSKKRKEWLLGMIVKWTELVLEIHEQKMLRQNR